MEDKNLIVEVKEDVLSISIGIEILCHACGVGRGYGRGDIKITNKKLFIENFARQLESEEADGSTLVHEMFDRAVTAMLENGEHGVDFLEDV